MGVNNKEEAGSAGPEVYEYWLARIPGISGRKKQGLRERFGNARNLYHAKFYRQDYLTPKELDALQKAQQETEPEMQEQAAYLLQKNIRFVPFFSPEFPARLLEISSPPYALYVKGALPDPDRPAVALVGARTCTPYGEQMAAAFGEKLAKAGAQVISGMARGIDGAGQRGAISGGGATFGVLGGGVDVCYPRENIGLYMDIQGKGGLLSEQLPGSAPKPTNFPARNRIISGLADVVLVMEAREKSGSLITADMALDEGKDVYALPGPVTSALSLGCHRLIRQGAGILISPEDLLEELKLTFPGPVKTAPAKAEEKLKGSQAAVYGCLDLFPKGIEELAKESGLAPEVLLSSLVELEMAGKVKETSKNYYCKVLH